MTGKTIFCDTGKTVFRTTGIFSFPRTGETAFRATGISPCHLQPAKQMVDRAAKEFRDRFPDLLLLDSLYFNQPFFELIRAHQGHLLIKSNDPSSQEVLTVAKFVFENKKDLVVPAEEKHGFDYIRICSCRIEITSGEFAGYPIQIAHLPEDYPKRKKNQHQECWIVTTDLTLLPEEIRESGNLPLAHRKQWLQAPVTSYLTHVFNSLTVVFLQKKNKITEAN